MSVWTDPADLRKWALGIEVTKASGTLAAETKALFTVSGRVMVTSFYGVVTTAITVANSFKLQHNPTTGATSDLVAATDIGTTDTPIGNVVGFSGVKTASIVHGPGSAPTLTAGLVMTAGSIEQVSAGTDGAITWYLTYVPLDASATVVAA